MSDSRTREDAALAASPRDDHADGDRTSQGQSGSSRLGSMTEQVATANQRFTPHGHRDPMTAPTIQITPQRPSPLPTGNSQQLATPSTIATHMEIPIASSVGENAHRHGVMQHGSEPHGRSIGNLISDIRDAPSCISVTFHGAHGKKYEAKELQKLEKGVNLYVSTVPGQQQEVHTTTVTGLPQFLQDIVWFLPVDMDSAEQSGHGKLITGHSRHRHHVRPLVLLPSLMRPPMWLRQQYTLLDEQMFVPCEWGAKGHLEKALLWLANKKEVMRQQVLSVWYSNRVYGPMEEFVMFGADSKGEVTDRPFVPAFLISKDKAQLEQVCVQWSQQSAQCEATYASPSSTTEEMDATNWVLDLNRSGAISIASVDKTSVEAAIMKVLDMRNEGIIKLLLFAGHFSEFFKGDHVAAQVERLAVDRNDVGLLMELVSVTRRELSFRALQFLIHTWSLQLQSEKSKLSFEKMQEGLAPAHDKNDEDIELFLINYIRTRRNPLSVASAVSGAILDEIEQYEESARYIQDKCEAFRSLTLALLDELQDQELSLTVLHKMLHPSESPRTVNDVSPLLVAFNDVDMPFISHELMYTYVKESWLGRRFLALTSCKDERSISLRNPLFGYRILKGIGFGGGPMRSMLKFGMITWHMSTFCSSAFFNSPRGRWCMHALSELLFLAIYQVLVIYPFESGRHALSAVFLVWVLGNFADMSSFIVAKYGDLSGIVRYMRDPWYAVNIITNSILLVLAIVMAYNYTTANLDFVQNRESWLHMSLCTAGVLVWVRALSLVVPVYPRLGPLLTTVSKMISEIVAFIFPYLVILSGFATLMTGVYAADISSYSNWITSMLTLFQAMLGNFDFSQFQQNDEGVDFSQSLYIFGTIVLVVFLVTVAILLLNLLVAIIILRYDPDSSEDQTQFKRAQIVDAYALQVQTNKVCSPLNLVHLCLFWLPSHQRPMNRSHLSRVMLLVNPDGELLPEMLSNPDYLQHTGKGEFPHFAFLLTAYPILTLVPLFCYFLCAPFAVLQFSHHGWERIKRGWLRSSKVAEGPAEAKGHHPSIVTYLRKPFDHIQTPFSRNQQTAGPRVLEYILKLPVMAVLVIIGTVIYVVVLGVFVLCFWFALVCWVWKLLFSLYNMLVYPWARMASDAKSSLARKSRSWGNSSRAHSSRSAAVRSSREAGSEDDEEREEGGAGPRPSQGSVTQGMPATPARDVRQRWMDVKDSVTQELYVGRLLSQQVVDNALANSKFRSSLARWKIATKAMKADKGEGKGDVPDAADSAELKVALKDMQELLTKVADTQTELTAKMKGMQQALEQLQMAKQGAEGNGNATTVSMTEMQPRLSRNGSSGQASVSQLAGASGDAAGQHTLVQVAKASVSKSRMPPLPPLQPPPGPQQEPHG